MGAEDEQKHDDLRDLTDRTVGVAGQTPEERRHAGAQSNRGEQAHTPQRHTAAAETDDREQQCRDLRDEQRPRPDRATKESAKPLLPRIGLDERDLRLAAAGQPADILEIEERVVIARRIHDVKRSNRFQGVAQGIMNVSQPDDQVRGSFCYILHVGIKQSAADNLDAFCIIPDISRVLPEFIVDGNGIKS